MVTAAVRSAEKRWAQDASLLLRASSMQGFSQRFLRSFSVFAAVKGLGSGST
jgi:hypothetical protein